MRQRWTIWPAVVALVWLSVQQVAAHPGHGSATDAPAPMVPSPEELVGAVGLALLAGQGGRRYVQVLLWTLSAAWLVGCLLGLQSESLISRPFVAAVFLLAFGVTVALDKRPSLLVLGLWGVLFGAFHGLANGAAAAQGLLEWTGLACIGLLVGVLVAVGSALTMWLKPAWTRVAVRVLGSWIGAIGLLMIGWAMR